MWILTKELWAEEMYITYIFIYYLNNIIYKLLWPSQKTGTRNDSKQNSQLLEEQKDKKEQVLSVKERTPVSYTHLDVYKRQQLSYANPSVQYGTKLPS